MGSGCRLVEPIVVGPQASAPWLVRTWEHGKCLQWMDMLFLPAQNPFFLLMVTMPHVSFSKPPHLYCHLIGALTPRTPCQLPVPGISWSTCPFPSPRWLVQGRAGGARQSGETQVCAFCHNYWKRDGFSPCSHQAVGGSLEFLEITTWNKLARGWTDSENRRAENWREGHSSVLMKSSEPPNQICPKDPLS